MQSQIYKIDETQIDTLVKRLALKNIIILLLVMVFVVGSQYLTRKESDIQRLLMSQLFIIPILFLPIYLASKRVKKSYKTQQIMLSDAGVESKAEMMPYKNISWDNLIINEKPNGTINLYDKSISAFSRKMNGRGWIIIHPEILNREQLLTELLKYQRN